MSFKSSHGVGGCGGAREGEKSNEPCENLRNRRTAEHECYGEPCEMSAMLNQKCQSNNESGRVSQCNSRVCLDHHGVVRFGLFVKSDHHRKTLRRKTIPQCKRT